MPLKLQADGSYAWKPNSARQEQFLSLPDSIFEGLYGGAAGGGKSELLLMLPIAREFYRYPAFRGIIFRRSFPQLQRSLIPRSYLLYPKFGGQYNETKHEWKFPSGAIIFFGHLDQDKDAPNHDTDEYNYLGFDELTAFTEYMYRYMTSRVRTSTERLPAIIRSATNPGNVGHAWVRKRFVEPAPQGLIVLTDAKSKSKRIFIPAKLTDNVDLMQSDPDYINRLNALPEAERKAKMDGDWWVFSGQVFTSFRHERIADEPANAMHSIEPFKIPAYWPKILAIDWGYRAATFAIWAAISPDGRIFVYREYVAKGRLITEWGADIKRLSQMDENLIVCALDPSAWQDRGQDMTIADQVIDILDPLPVTQADNDRLGGMNLCFEMIRWQQRPQKYIPKEGYVHETAERILRLYGVEASEQYSNMFLPEKEETNLPKLQIFNTCPELISVIITRVYAQREDDAAVRGKAKREDVAETNDDDGYDCLRYLLKEIVHYGETSDAEFKKRAEVGSILARLAATRDQNDFYQGMERMEARRTSLDIRPGKRSSSRLGVGTFGRAN